MLGYGRPLTSYGAGHGPVGPTRVPTNDRLSPEALVGSPYQMCACYKCPGRGRLASQLVASIRIFGADRR
jgi:hypothetical protein